MREGVHAAMGIAFSGAAIAALIAASTADTGANNERRALEATIRMERLATNLEHAKRIAPETKLEIVGLIGQPRYNCDQVACRSATATRNRAVRTRLQTVLTGSVEGHANELGAGQIGTGAPLLAVKDRRPLPP